MGLHQNVKGNGTFRKERKALSEATTVSAIAGIEVTKGNHALTSPCIVDTHLLT
jgi:hypothetical protein